MTWPSFVVVYTILAALAVLVCRRTFGGRWWRLARCMLGAVSLAFFVDYTGEDRSFWDFTKLSSYSILDVPVENLLFIVASAPLIILIHSWAKARFPPPISRLGNPEGLLHRESSHRRDRRSTSQHLSSR